MPKLRGNKNGLKQLLIGLTGQLTLPRKVCQAKRGAGVGVGKLPYPAMAFFPKCLPAQAKRL